MNVWRVHLKPKGVKEGITNEDVLEFCIEEQIIGVGWTKITCTTDDDNALRLAVNNSSYEDEDKKAGFKATNAIRQMKPGDLVWTRLGGDASEYYLCRVGNKLWKDRIITQRHIDHDIGQFVSATWVKIGKIDRVPGKVINSFIPRATAQKVNEVTNITKHIWNMECNDTALRYNDVGEKDFWSVINSEDLECLVLLYLQSLGYYIYSSTLKKVTAKYETVMVSENGKTKFYPQVKREETLFPEDYIKGLKDNEKTVLFTTSESYGKEHFDNAICLTRAELETFIRNNQMLLPDSVKYWLELAEFK